MNVGQPILCQDKKIVCTPDVLRSADSDGNSHPHSLAVSIFLHFCWHSWTSAGSFASQSPYGLGNSWICQNTWIFMWPTEKQATKKKLKGLTCFSCLETNKDVLSWSQSKSIVSHSYHIWVVTEENLRKKNVRPEKCCLLNRMFQLNDAGAHEALAFTPKSIWVPIVYSSFSTLSTRLNESSAPAKGNIKKNFSSYAVCWSIDTPYAQHMLTRLCHSCQRRFSIEFITDPCVSQVNCKILAYVTELSPPHTSEILCNARTTKEPHWWISILSNSFCHTYLSEFPFDVQHLTRSQLS